MYPHDATRGQISGLPAPRGVRLLDADTAAIPITRSERYALLAARGIFDMFRGSQLHKDIESVSDKLMEATTAETRRDTGSLATKIHYRPSGGTKSYEGYEDIINALITGLLKERQVRFTYRQRSGRKSQGIMAPYAMVIHGNGLYVIARRLENETGPVTQTPRQFAVERFLEADWIRRSKFEYPADFSVEDYFDGAFGLISGRKRHHVVVDLNRSVRAEATTRRWHRSQICTPVGDGRTRIEFDVSSLREVVSWVLEWGLGAEVVEPVELRMRLIAVLDATRALYD